MCWISTNSHTLHRDTGRAHTSCTHFNWIFELMSSLRSNYALYRDTMPLTQHHMYMYVGLITIFACITLYRNAIQTFVWEFNTLVLMYFWYKVVTCLAILAANQPVYSYLEQVISIVSVSSIPVMDLNRGRQVSWNRDL